MGHTDEVLCQGKEWRGSEGTGPLSGSRAGPWSQRSVREAASPGKGEGGQGEREKHEAMLGCPAPPGRRHTNI